MNLALFFEGTGQGVSGRFTNVTRLFEAAVESPAQLRHLESGPGTRFGAYLFGRTIGVDARAILSRARRWFEANYRSLPPRTSSASRISTRVFLFGFSRGALLARHFAAWLDKLGVEVAYMGLWDTVDSTVGIDVPERCPPNVRFARHAVARDEHRKHFDYVPLRAPMVEELLFPGSHSDVGGLYADNHLIADVALAWIADGARSAGLEFAEAIRAPSSAATCRIHDSLGLVSNLFGLLGRIERRLSGIPRHPLCDRTSGRFSSVNIL